MIFPEKQRLMNFVLLGLCSGILSGILLHIAITSFEFIDALFFLPGIIFGVCIVLPFYRRGVNKLLRAVLAVVVSTIAYYLSVIVMLSLPEGPIGLPIFATLLIGIYGLVGALVLGVGLIGIYKLQQRAIVLSLILFSGYFFASFSLLFNNLGSLVDQSLLHGLWQAGAAASLSFGEPSKVSTSHSGKQKTEPLIQA